MWRNPVVLALAMTAGPAVGASSGDANAVTQLVQRFNAARAAFDPKALADTISPDFEEISPIGEIDPREKMLGFYAPELQKPSPPMTVSDPVVHASGGVAVMTERRSFMPPGSAVVRSVRVRYVARRTGRDWKLISAQYTPIPAGR